MKLFYAAFAAVLALNAVDALKLRNGGLQHEVKELKEKELRKLELEEKEPKEPKEPKGLGASDDVNSLSEDVGAVSMGSMGKGFSAGPGSNQPKKSEAHFYVIRRCS